MNSLKGRNSPALIPLLSNGTGGLDIQRAAAVGRVAEPFLLPLDF